MKLFMLRGVNSTNGRLYANTIVELPADQATTYIASALGRKPTAKDKAKAAAFLEGSPIADMLIAEDKKREDAKLALEASENDDGMDDVSEQLSVKVIELAGVQEKLETAHDDLATANTALAEKAEDNILLSSKLETATDDLAVANTAVSDAEESLQEKQEKIDALEKEIEQLTSPNKIDAPSVETAS